VRGAASSHPPRGELDTIVSHDAPLDVLTQQIVAEAVPRGLLGR
jgi:Lhr-like helicase